MAIPVLRVARPTDQLDAATDFYCRGLGFQLLGQFRDHGGFDGNILGHPNAPWHLELTHKRGVAVGRAPTHDNLLVLYIPDHAEWCQYVDRARSHGYEPIPSFNPYWDRRGITFEDPDGYRVVLQNSAWGT